MSRLVVTGASGFIGAALVQHLRRLGRPCAGISRRAGPAVDAVVPDYTRAALTPWVREGDVLVHLAARAHRPGPAHDDDFADNLRTTAALVEVCRAQGVARLVFMSSVGVHGQRTVDTPFTERDAPAPEEAYGRSKLACEQGVAAAAGLDHVIVRPPLVYGAGAPGNFARLALAVARGWPLPLGAIRNRRSFVAVDNLVDFLALCATHPAARHQTFLVADGEDLSTPQWITRMAAAAGRRSPRLLPVPPACLRAAGTLLGRRGATQRLCDSLQVDSTLARTTLGWTPVVGVDEGLRRAMAPLRMP